MKQIDKYIPGIPANGLFFFFSLVLLMAFSSSCNKDFPNTLRTSYREDTLGLHSKKQKVLYIIVDGWRGAALKTMDAPHLNKILDHSVYTYDGLSDFDGSDITNAGAWSNMLTGVSRAKHGVVTEDFSGNKLAQFPSIFTRLKQSDKGNLRTASFSASSAFGLNLAADAQDNRSFPDNDLAVKDAVNEELKNPDATLVLAQFHQIESVGTQHSYSETDPAYVDAVKQVDGYIGDILNQLEKREAYAAENWLVVIAANKGGTLPPDPNNTDQSKFSDQSRNTFVVFYNPRFNTQILPKPNVDNIPFTGNGIRVRATESFASVPDDGGLYNFGSSGDYTVQVKFKAKSPINTNYPAFFSKKASALESVVGWYMYCEGSEWKIIFKGTNGAASLSSGTPAFDGLWHTATFVLSHTGNSRFATIYTDGKLGGTRDISGIGSINSPAALRIGQVAAAYGSNNLDFVMADIEIFKAALSAEDIQKYAKIPFVDASNPNFKNLIGYWPASEGTGPRIADLSGNDKHFVNSGEYAWDSFSDVSPFLSPLLNPSFYRLVPNNVDIPFYIYQWLGVAIPPSWEQEGKLWKTSFTDIKLPY